MTILKDLKLEKDSFYINSNVKATFLWKALLNLIFVICQGVLFGMIIYYNLSYNCSDDITNGIFRKENKKTKNNIILIAINFGVDVFNLFINLIYLVYYICRRESERKRNKVHEREIVTNRMINNNNSNEKQNNQPRQIRHNNNSLYLLLI